MRFISPTWRRFFRVLLSLGVVMLSTAILFVFKDYLSTPVIAILYLIPVVFSATFSGKAGSILASVVSFLCLNYFFIYPHYTFNVAQLQDLLVMLVLLGVALLVSSLMSSAQNRLEAVQAREREAVALYELSAAFTGQTDAAVIAETLADRLIDILGAKAVEVVVHHPDAAVRVIKPATLPTSETHPDRVIPLASREKSIGELRIWDGPPNLRREDERLLQTIAGQSSLAMERTILAAGEQRARVLEESDRLKTAILSSVSHELRTPLATIQASATGLFNPSVELEPDARRELQSLLLEETDHLTQLVGNLLNMSRIEAGALKLQLQWNSIAEIAEVAIQHLRRLAARHEIHVDIPEELPLVFVDSVLMEQVFINLLNNSLKFTPPEKIIRVSAEEENGTLKVTIQNQGPPIPEASLQHIFEKFAIAPGFENPKSTGLGLSICKGIVEAHSGRIWAANLPDGVAFYFSLPLSTEGARPVLPQEE
ncbi:MAG: DUF4118 domain-containing protein [Anaerolineaceae bacterium]|nr:DUF4118 domain-containing protein [Anaerolineaceae bacterium]